MPPMPTIASVSIASNPPTLARASSTAAGKGFTASLYFNRGTAYTNLGKHAEAVADLSRAIDLRKDFANAFYNRGISH